VWNLPKFIHGNRVLAGAVNGWQLSGYTTYQAARYFNQHGWKHERWFSRVALRHRLWARRIFRTTLSLLANGLYANAMNPSTWFGSSSYNLLQPVVTCDPRKPRIWSVFQPELLRASAILRATGNSQHALYCVGLPNFDSGLRTVQELPDL